MTNFKLPQIQMTLSDYMEIVNLQKSAGTCVGFFIALGKEFFSTGLSEVDNDILPTLVEKAGLDVDPRVIPSYAMLLWFTVKVSRNRCTVSMWSRGGGQRQERAIPREGICYVALVYCEGESQ